MAKKKPTGKGQPPPKEVLYVEMDATLKRRLARLAFHRSRKITAEAIIAIRRYVDEEDQKENLPPLEEGT
jgi:hypothetical protein